MAVLSYEQRKRLAKKTFAIPGKKSKSNPAGQGGYPIPDIAHARNALARVAQFGSAKEKAEVRAKVYARFPELNPRNKK